MPVTLSEPATWNLRTGAPTFSTARFPRQSVLRQMGPLLGRDMTDARRRRLIRKATRMIEELDGRLQLSADTGEAA